jgi:serine/threonine-protein kinase
MFVAQQHLNAPRPRPSRVKDGLSRTFDRVVARAMAKDPRDRFQSAGDLARAAAAAAQGSRLPRGTHSVATGMAAPVPARVGHRGRNWLHRHRVVLAAVLSTVVLTGGAVLLLTAGDDPPAAPVNAAGELVGEPIHLPVQPERLVSTSGVLWAMTIDTGRRARVDAAGEVRGFAAATDLGGGLFPAMAAGAGGVWTTQAYDPSGGVTKFDARTGEAIARVTLARAFAVTAGPEGVWATTSPGQGRRDGGVVQIDPQSGRVITGPLPAGSDPAAATVAGGSLWVTDGRSDRLLRLDPGTLRLRERVSAGDGPGLLAADGDVLWVANVDERTLLRVDARSGDPIGAPIGLGKEIDDLLVTRDGVWVAGGDNTVTRLARASGSQIGTAIPVGRAPLTLAPADQGVWVGSSTDSTVQRIRDGR